MGLPDKLAPVVARLNALADSLGVRRARVYYGTRTWSGEEIGAGTPVYVWHEIHPPPRIDAWDGHRWTRFSAGELPRGDVRLRLIPLSHDPSDLVVLDPDAGVEHLWRIDDQDRKETTLLRATARPEFRASGWRVILEHLEEPSEYMGE